MKVLYSMMKYICKNRWLWLLGIIIPAFSSTATNIYFASRLQDYIVQVTEQQSPFQSVSKTLIITLFALMILSCIDNFGLYMFSLFCVYTEKELRNDYYRSIVNTSLNNMQRLNHGELISRYNTDIEHSAKIVSDDIFGVIYPLIVGIGYMTAVFLSNLWIGIIMFLLGVMAITLNFMFVNKMKRAQEEILKAKEVYISNCNNAIRGKISIRQYSAKEMMSKKINQAAGQLYRKECNAVGLEMMKLLTSDALANSCNYLLTPLACVAAVLGYMSVPIVLFIHQLCRCFIMYTQNFANSFVDFKKHALSYERVNLIKSFKSEVAESIGNRNESFPENCVITFKNVCVSYKKNQILKDVSFTVLPGECVGIIGESGSGKSTLVKTLMQMIDYSGEIYIGEKNCKNIDLHSLREHIAFSPEHSDVFHDTVYENIRFGNLNALEDDINYVASRAAIMHRETFLYRNVGENGEQLSGGQKQKVSIARALLKNAPIIIFDEPTAALDADSESKIIDTILKLKEEGKSILLITHKNSTLCIADRILHIKEGKVFQV